MITIVDHFSIGSFYDQVPFCTGLTKITVRSALPFQGIGPDRSVLMFHPLCNRLMPR
jgi:hypothetical protein